MNPFLLYGHVVESGKTPRSQRGNRGFKSPRVHFIIGNAESIIMIASFQWSFQHPFKFRHKSKTADNDIYGSVEMLNKKHRRSGIRLLTSAES